MNDFHIPEIDNKILNGEELTEEEVRLVFWEYSAVTEIEGEHHRWWYPLEKIIKINERYFSVWAAMGLTENQDTEYEAQIAEEVYPKQIMTTVWERVDKSE